ncbi:hypothetical protein [Methylobacterium iners]|uniref:Uncharacterized protein n=1 Tax=Methylobacterium iners TaxID=418707 RepID=A0ABQ4RTA8_9HYPH|nr:hypothetical protein [Methylobacterium iners]GJD93439.1 hypothetical protein OCOJLMKI_0633 [Methylobacterium iners]
MSDAPVVPITPETLELGSEWREAADLAAHNLGFSPALAELSPEHWQLVLASVTDRMRLRGASLPVGWRRALARQVGRGDGEDKAQGKVLALAAKRKEIAAHLSRELGLGDLADLGPADRDIVDQQTTETIVGCSPDTAEPADCSDADRTMRRLLSEHRALEEMTTDAASPRPAEEGEEFSPEDGI